MGATGALDLADCLNAVCPWSGKPVAADSLTLYRGKVVGFCNPGCREKFETAVAMFETVIAGKTGGEG
jgi:YHS domain-containing protein